MMIWPFKKHETCSYSGDPQGQESSCLSTLDRFCVFYRYVFMKDPALVSACFMEDTKMKSNTTRHHDDNKDGRTATPQTDEFHKTEHFKKYHLASYSFSAHTEVNTGGMKQTNIKKPAPWKAH